MVERDKGQRIGSGQRVMYLTDDLTKMAEKLDALPNAGGRRGLSRADAVMFLAPQIEALRKKNYTTKDVCEALTEVGLKITPAQLWKLMPARKLVARGVRGAAESASRAASRSERGSRVGGLKTASKEDGGNRPRAPDAGGEIESRMESGPLAVRAGETVSNVSGGDGEASAAAPRPGRFLIKPDRERL